MPCHRFWQRKLRKARCSHPRLAVRPGADHPPLRNDRLSPVRAAKSMWRREPRDGQPHGLSVDGSSLYPLQSTSDQQRRCYGKGPPEPGIAGLPFRFSCQQSGIGATPSATSTARTTVGRGRKQAFQCQLPAGPLFGDSDRYRSGSMGASTLGSPSRATTHLRPSSSTHGSSARAGTHGVRRTLTDSPGPGTGNPRASATVW